MTAQTDLITLTCPICKLEHSAPLTRRIDLEAGKEAREKLLRGEYFYFSCPDCGYLSELHYGCLALDRPLRLAIYLAEEHDACPADTAARVAADVPFCQAGDSLLRAVRSAQDLAEKLRIFDAGLDDRLVEICKGAALSQFPATETCYVTDIRYDAAGGREVLRLTLSDGTEDYVLGFDALYRQISDQFSPSLPPLRGGGFALVDLDYAAALMRGFEEV